MTAGGCTINLTKSSASKLYPDSGRRTGTAEGEKPERNGLGREGDGICECAGVTGCTSAVACRPLVSEEVVSYLVTISP